MKNNIVSLEIINKKPSMMDIENPIKDIKIEETYTVKNDNSLTFCTEFLFRIDSIETEDNPLGVLDYSHEHKFPSYVKGKTFYK